MASPSGTGSEGPSNGQEGSPQSEPLYHLVQATLWRAAVETNTPYYPPTFEQDGFTHATLQAELLLSVANHFYRGVQGEYLCLTIDPAALTPIEVKFEPAAPVGDTEALSSPAQQDEGVVLFPHIYGPIPASAVTKELRVIREEADGTFLSIEGIHH